MKKSIIYIVLIFFIAVPAGVLAQPVSFQGQLSGWVGYSETTSSATLAAIGLRYIPESRISKSLGKEKEIDAEIALNCHISAPIDSPDKAGDNSDAGLYRLWLRYSTSQFETRLGLQKINFGPAKIIRSLMWFDTLDPRDPFKLTDGVYGILARYYFLNNSNIWVWGLYGNDNLKGLERVKTDSDKGEFGGRYQFPVPGGELGVSLHQRYVDPIDWNIEMSSTISDGLENRYALDGDWDIGVGLWFEASAEETKIDQNQQMWRKFLTIGTDYTFEPGIHVLFEHFIYSTGSKLNRSDQTAGFSALLADYRLGIMDSVNIIGYYDHGNKEIYPYLGWQRTYDNWQINLLAFSSPQTAQSGSGGFSGKGIQCIFTYNH